MSSRDRDAEGRPRYAGPRDRLGRPSADPEAPGPRTPELPEDVSVAIDLGAGLFDRERFFEAHEVFEHVWNSDAVGRAERPFWKAVTQVCVGCCHLQRGNRAGAVSVLARAARTLAAWPRPVRGVDGAALARLASVAAARGETGPFPRA